MSKDKPIYEVISLISANKIRIKKQFDITSPLLSAIKKEQESQKNEKVARNLMFVKSNMIKFKKIKSIDNVVFKIPEKHKIFKNSFFKLLNFDENIILNAKYLSWIIYGMPEYCEGTEIEEYIEEISQISYIKEERKAVFKLLELYRKGQHFLTLEKMKYYISKPFLKIEDIEKIPLKIKDEFLYFIYYQNNILTTREEVLN